MSEPAAGEPGAKPESYETASARVEEIVRRLDSGQAGLRETLELVREELRLDELVARLEGEHGGGAA